MAKKLAPPPDRGGKEKSLDETIDAQRRAARKRAEEKRARRLAERKQSTIETLGQAISEMTSMTQEASSTVTELESTLAEIAASAAQTSNATEESEQAIKQANDAIDAAQRTTQTSLENIEMLQNLVSMTSEGIRSLIVGVNATVTTNQETTSLLDALENEISDIEHSVTTVMAISDRINLFALNAAIEASRAGEHGAGFSVVADEIRKLAEQTERTASQIVDAVRTVRENVNVVNEGLTSLIAQARTDADTANTITVNLSSAAEDMEMVRQGAAKIRDLAKAHSSELENMLANSLTIISGANQAAAATQEASASLQQQVKALEAITNSAGDIDEQIDTIREEKYTERAAEELATSAEELSATIEQSSSAIQQISASLAEIAQSASQQANSSQENSTLAVVIETSANGILEESQSSEETTLSQQQQFRQIDTETATMIERISAIAQNYGEAAKDVRVLDTEMSQLERVVGKLSTTNILTHLLAVNGRVESARAGEHGMGFASVSEDIRGLVEQSAEQILEMGERVNAIRKTIATISADIEMSGMRVRQDVETATQTTSRLVQVEDNMVDILAGVKVIRSAAGDSLTALESIKRNIDSITQAAEQASTACQQASSAADELEQAMRDLASTSEEIAAQADAL